MHPGLETAVNLGWTASKNETTFGVGCKYALDKDAFVRAKVNNSSQVGLGYQQKLREGKQFLKLLLSKKFVKSQCLENYSLYEPKKIWEMTMSKIVFKKTSQSELFKHFYDILQSC